MAGFRAAAAEEGKEEDDDVDLFGSDDDDEEDAEAARIREERLAAYREKKAGKPKVAAKSVVIMDVKPWGAFSLPLFLSTVPTPAWLKLTTPAGPTDDETDMKALEESVRSIEKDGLVWGAAKLVPIGYGVSKLQISLVVEDEKVSLDELQEEIAGFEDYVQSSDIVSSLPRNVCLNPFADHVKPRLLCKSCELLV